MLIAITGATGFLGRFITNHLLSLGHACRCWYRNASDRSGFIDDGKNIDWQPGRLNHPVASDALVTNADAVVHAALEHGRGWAPRGDDLLQFAETNILGSLRLMQSAKAAAVPRFIFISTCAVHDVILPDRTLDEAHPLWPTSHYGAHKAAIEKFIHSFGLNPANPKESWGICSLRPTGIYGLAHPASKSKWFDLVRDVIDGKPIDDARGGKEVHAHDVAQAVNTLLNTDPASIAGQAYNCYDMYIAREEVAQIAKQITKSPSQISTRNPGPKNQIDTAKLRALGLTFGSKPLLEKTINQLITAIQANP